MFTPDSTSFVGFVALESVSRRMRQRVWETPFPGDGLTEFVINPRADVIAVVVEEDPGYVTHTGRSFFMLNSESQ